MNQLVLVHRSAPASPPIRTASAMLGGLKEQLAVWRSRQRQRAALLSLSDADLQDIGISRAQANFETNKPFWQN
jgi:uncharacterized protein YjiS (DUF1127 family)